MFLKKSKSITLLILAFLFPLTAYTQDGFQVEIDVNSLQLDEASDETRLLLIGAEIFFDEVDVGSHPYAEAAFLERQSSVLVAYLTSDSDTTTTDIEITSFAFAINYVVPDSSLVTGFILQSIDGDIKNGLTGTVDGSSFGFMLGSYINKNSYVEVSYIKSDSDLTILPSTTSTANVTDIDISYKLVKELQGDQAFNIEVTLTSSKYDDNVTVETNTLVELLGDYYFNQSISVGARIESNTGDEKTETGKTLGLDFNVFVTSSIAVYAEFNQFSADTAAAVDTDEITFGAKARF